MAKQDDFVRITLRLPPDLHKQLIEAAGASSLNAEIVARLERSFFADSYPGTKEFDQEVKERVLLAAHQLFGEILKKIEITVEEIVQEENAERNSQKDIEK